MYQSQNRNYRQGSYTMEHANYGRNSNRFRFEQAMAREYQPKKRSGAKFGYANGDSEKPYVTGWMVRNKKLTAFIGGRYSSANNKTRTVKSKNGFDWETWSVKVTPEYEKPYFVWGLFCRQTQKLVIREMGLVLNPKAPNGGYTGRYGQKAR